jgi:GT2 family glycosyltransferase
VSVAVLFLDGPQLSSLRAAPKDLCVVEGRAQDAVEIARSVDAPQLLIVEPDGYAGPQTFAAAHSLDAAGGILGGCGVDGHGTKRFGNVFASVPFGPYAIEPFPLVDVKASSGTQQPQPDAVDTVCPGVYVVDREAFVELGGFDCTFGSPWRLYDLCMRIREAGRPVRWDAALSFALASGVVRPSEAIDHRDFMRRWSDRLVTRFDFGTPARGAVRRALRLPLGQREVVTIRLPPTDVIVYGHGPVSANAVRGTTRSPGVSVRDARGADVHGLEALRAAFRKRSDRYVAVVDAAQHPAPGWLERMVVDLESRPNAPGIRRGGCAVLAPARIPLDTQPPAEAASMAEALERLFAPRASAGTRLSVVYVAHCQTTVHRTSFEGVYGELDVDYHAVVTPSRPELVDLLKTHGTLDVIVDDSRGMARGVNAALSRARGDVVIVVSDEFCPPPRWIELVRGAFALRPEMGLLGFGAPLTEGPQGVDVVYSDMKSFRAAAEQRRTTLARDARLCDRLTALAFALDARALGAVGGFDPKLGAGRWGVEDLSLRVRAAGYAIYVADDLFLHRFQTEMAQPFLKDGGEEARSAKAFAQKWKAANAAGYEPRAAILRGFDPGRDFIPLSGDAA